MNRTQKPAVKSSSPLPTSTTTPVTTISETSELCANVATSNMTKSTMNEHEQEPEASSGIIANTSSLNGTNKGLQESQVEHSAIAQIRTFRKEEYPITMDAIKLFLTIHGSSSPNYGVNGADRG